MQETVLIAASRAKASAAGCKQRLAIFLHLKKASTTRAVKLFPGITLLRSALERCRGGRPAAATSEVAAMPGACTCRARLLQASAWFVPPFVQRVVSVSKATTG